MSAVWLEGLVCCVFGGWGGGISFLINFRNSHLKYIYKLSILNIRINVVNIQKYTTHKLILHFLKIINWDRLTFISNATMPQPQTVFHDYFFIISLYLELRIRDWPSKTASKPSFQEITIKLFIQKMNFMISLPPSG